MSEPTAEIQSPRVMPVAEAREIFDAARDVLPEGSCGLVIIWENGNIWACDAAARLSDAITAIEERGYIVSYFSMAYNRNAYSLHVSFGTKAPEQAVTHAQP